jgi:hypothetical protein
LTREYQPFHPTPLLIRNIIKKKLKKKKKREKKKKKKKKERRKEGRISSQAIRGQSIRVQKCPIGGKKANRNLRVKRSVRYLIFLPHRSNLFRLVKHASQQLF